MIELKLSRKKYTDKQVIGTLEVWKDKIFECVLSTLELEWDGNTVTSSCIPKGEYKVGHYSSEKYPNVLEIKDVRNRTHILIHAGNYHKHTKGCVLVGFTHTDINNDNYKDVVYSKKALDKLMKICNNESEISINIF